MRVQLIATLLLAIVLSWLLGSGIAYYVAYRNMTAMHEAMLARPDLYPAPPPAPRFTFRDFLLGAPRPMMGQGRPQPQHPEAWRPGPPRGGMRPLQPGAPPRPRPNDPPPQAGWTPQHTGLLIVRIGSAVLLALIVGAVVSRRFTRPLGVLAQGARQYSRGRLQHRIPMEGEDEFAQVAASMHEMADTLGRQMQQLKDDADRRQRMLANVAHELRSPVMTMRTMAGAMAEGLADDPARRARAVASLVQTSDRLLHLVNDVLDLARLDLHELPIHAQDFDLTEVVDRSLQAYAPQAERAGVCLPETVGAEPVMVNADPIRMGQVIDNLISNAIAYAGAGAQVTARVEPDNPVRLTIADTGRGIPARHLPHIFEPFYRADAVRTPGDNHAGLGLRIARSLLEAQGGTFTLTSEEGRGTTVVMTLPKG